MVLVSHRLEEVFPVAALVRTGGTQVKDATAEALGGTPDDVFADTAIRTYRLELM